MTGLKLPLMLISIMIGCDSEKCWTNSCAETRKQDEFASHEVVPVLPFNRVYKFTDGDVVCYISYGYHEHSISCLRKSQ